MARTATIQSAIRSELMQQSPCTLEALLDRLPQFSWSEIFTVVDQLSRDGHLVLRHPTRFDYEVSIGRASLTPESDPVYREVADNFVSSPGNPSFQPREDQRSHDQ
jgi:hypothetical protein